MKIDKDIMTLVCYRDFTSYVDYIESVGYILYIHPTFEVKDYLDNLLADLLKYEEEFCKSLTFEDYDLIHMIQDDLDFDVGNAKAGLLVSMRDIYSPDCDLNGHPFKMDYRYVSG